MESFRELDELQNRLGSFFGGFPQRAGNGNGEKLTLPDWSPSVDITEDDNEYLVKADLPEVKKDDVKVVVENGILSFPVNGKARKKKEKEIPSDRKILRSFERTFALPEDADASKIVADFKEGVLKVHLPKSPAAKPNTIEVKVA